MKPANQMLNEEIILKGISDPSNQQVKMMISQCEQSPCLLCGGDPDMVGVFSPPGSGAFGAAPGKARQFFYSICNNCLATDGWMGIVQDIMKSKSKSMKWR